MPGHLAGSQIGIVGGIIGAVIGCVGGAIGTYCSIKNTNGPMERKFMIKVSAWTWIALILFLVLLIGLPSPYKFFMWIPYGIMLPMGIRYINKGQAEIRALESSQPKPSV
jgi:hypothetical protein